MIHTGDINPSLESLRVRTTPSASSRQARLDVHYVPGRARPVIDEGVKLYGGALWAAAPKGAGWYSFRRRRLCISWGSSMWWISRPAGLGNLGNDQLAWLEDDPEGPASASTPIVVVRATSRSGWSYPQWGWGHRRRRSGYSACSSASAR